MIAALDFLAVPTFFRLIIISSGIFWNLTDFPKLQNKKKNPNTRKWCKIKKRDQTHQINLFYGTAFPLKKKNKKKQALLGTSIKRAPSPPQHRRFDHLCQGGGGGGAGGLFFFSNLRSWNLIISLRSDCLQKCQETLENKSQRHVFGYIKYWAERSEAKIFSTFTWNLWKSGIFWDCLRRGIYFFKKI